MNWLLNSAWAEKTPKIQPTFVLIWALENLIQTFEFIKLKASWKEGSLLLFFKVTGNWTGVVRGSFFGGLSGDQPSFECV